MAIKESSDELNPTVISASTVASAKPARTVGDYVALAVATCGVGYIPIAPGTFGSVVGVGLWIGLRGMLLALLWSAAGRNRLNLLHVSYAVIAGLLTFAVLVTLVGTWAGARVEKLHGAKDPQKVVIDEVAGQLIALIAVPLDVQNWWTILLAFVLFRFFDIVKPYPARRFEELHGGLGIMADDVVAGIYAAICVALTVSIGWFR
ncbi:MAG TPA: phosphatidylglycerophosphatase A [Pyrinomonadaceae bacterium]